jgi:hypothetical protein
MEYHLHGIIEPVNRIEDCRHIHKKHCENAPKVLNIPEEYVHCRKNQSYAQIEDNKAYDRNYQHKEQGSENHAVYYTEQQEHKEGQAEIDKRGDIP